ncbi:hypothetical protein KC19_11G049700 [Ceratodon purpureus]|uniref:Enoyl reductase (ER) domain-containing protein n=1 Tax=Ceratodon purpureus TaxID=3225 RepID=A0A8T0GCC8_CERPU|nr:hypothetical protein KC19_11G049700 [Ceratodon purpureus]
MSNLALVQDGFHKEDPLSTLKVVTKPIPKASPGQVVVHITLRPINPVDFMTLRGGNVVNGSAGSEGFGIVHEVGEGVTKLHKGQRVIPVTAPGSNKGNGSFQKYVAIDADFVLPVPGYMSDEVAAQFVVNPWTAYSLLKLLEVPKGEYIIQSAAGSTLGKIVICLAKHYGIKTINIVRRSSQIAELKALGADEVICSAEEDVGAKLKEITGGKGAWGGLDAVFGTMTPMIAGGVRDEGKVYVYGMLGGYSTTLGVGDLFRGVIITAFVSFKLLAVPEKIHALAGEVAPLVKDGVIPVAEVEKYDLKEFKTALAKAGESGRAGKILLVTA